MTFTAATDTLYRTWAENQERKIAVRVQFAIENAAPDRFSMQPQESPL